MGLTNQNSGIKYLNIIKDKLALRVTKDTPGAIMRTNKNNQEVYELHFDNITAKIEGLEHEESDYGTSLKITLRDMTDVFILKLPAMEQHEGAFLKRLPNIDLKQEVTIGFVTFSNDKSKTGFRTYLYARQNDEKVENAYGLDDLPKFDEVMIKGKKTYDPTNHFNALYERSLKPAIEKLQGVVVENVTDDDIPF